MAAPASAYTAAVPRRAPPAGKDQGNRMQARELREADAALYAAKQAGRDRVGRAIAEPALA